MALALFLDVFGHASNCCFSGVDVASGINSDPFTHRAVGTVGLVGRNEYRDFPVFDDDAFARFEAATAAYTGRCARTWSLPGLFH